MLAHNKREPVMKPFFSSAACSIIGALLEKNHERRLGCREDGMAELKKHEFFAGLDWDKLARRELEAPFLPNLADNQFLYFDQTLQYQELHKGEAYDSLDEDTNRIAGFTYEETQFRRHLRSYEDEEQ
jgi:G protein-coupled receptor kinase